MASQSVTVHQVSSDATHSNIDTNSYQVAVVGGKEERKPGQREAGFEAWSGAGNRQPPLAAGDTHKL